MTQDYKDTLLRYLTGNLRQETGVDEPQFSALNIINNDLNSFIYQHLGIHYSIIDIVQGKNANNDGLNLYVLYGNSFQGKIIGSYFVIINEKFMPIYFIDSYDSGTMFENIMKINVDEQGQFYGIEEVNLNTTPRKRFIMLNNFLIKPETQQTYKVKLRQSYNLPTPLSDCDTFSGITKSQTQAKYLISGTYRNSLLNQPVVTELTINVGSTNDWKHYKYNDKTNFIGSGIYANWDSSGNITFKVAGVVYLQDNYYTEYTKGNNELDQYQIQLTEQPQDVAKCQIVNMNTTYFAYNTTLSSTMHLKINKIMYSTNTISNLVDKTKPTAGTQDIFLNVTNGILFYGIDYYDNNIINHLYVGMIRDMTVYEKDYGTSTVSRRMTNMIVTNQYNLYNIYGEAKDSTTTNSQLVYNRLEYNGLAFENNRSLIPQSGILYNDNIIIFARDLYNKTLYQNTTLSVMQIPNTLLNDIPIEMQNLIGTTNKILNSNTESYLKNIYETLYLNFYNTLTIENRNTQDYIINQLGSEALNQSVSSTGDYTDKKATKYRLNYSDNTTHIGTVQPTITNNIATYQFIIYVPSTKTINNVDIISQDETITYQTIDTSSLLNNKYYQISQECYVE